MTRTWQRDSILQNVGSDELQTYSAYHPSDQIWDSDTPSRESEPPRKQHLLFWDSREIPGERFLTSSSEKMVTRAQSHFGLRLTALSNCVRAPKYTFRAKSGMGVFGGQKFDVGPGSYNIQSTFRSRSSQSAIRNYFGASNRESVCNSNVRFTKFG